MRGMRERKDPSRWALTLLFSTFVFVILIVTMLFVGAVMFFFVQLGVFDDVQAHASGFLVPVIIFALTSIIVGMFVSTVIGSFPIKAVNRLISGMNRLSGGDYSVRISLRGGKVGFDLAKSFNTLAKELQNTEMLRSDFVNNFSHEFKTPIVSIRGFARLLQKADLSEQQRMEYLDIIAEESDRLADMATNVLNLTKVENQTILTDTLQYNVSEQLRSCLLLLEKGWTEKNLRIEADFDEYNIVANEELLKQVWINLLDNAIKFSPDGGEIAISITELPDSLDVSIRNTGPEIQSEEQKRVFDKFWQGDASHAASGTGIGLSIAKRIVELHSGAITIDSTKEQTVFNVVLPRQ